MKRLAQYFLRGLLLIAPVAITLYVCAWIFRAIDGLLGLPIPGLGFLLTLVVITVVGFLASPMSGFITGEVIDLNGGLHMD